MLRALSLFLMVCASVFAQGAFAQEHCLVGAWKLSGGVTLDISPAAEGGLRWRKFDGTTGELIGEEPHWQSMLGWTDDLDGHRLSGEACSEGRISFDGVEARRTPLDVRDTIFKGAMVKDWNTVLAGRLVLPKGAGPFPIVVLLQGSEDTSALRINALQRLLPSEGVGVFVYDKRGTGLSGGSYTQDFDMLAEDAVAALAEAKRLAGRRAGRVGFFGISLGGWVAPIAASRTSVDFVIVASALAISPLEQNRAQIVYEMEQKRHGEADIAGALEIAKAGERILLSGFTEGFSEFDIVRAKYRDEPWYKDVHGNYLYLMMPLTGDRLKTRENSFRVGTPWEYDPMPVLAATKTPQLWLLAEDDIKTPSAETARRIAGLRDKGLPFTLKLFPHAEHGMLEYQKDYRGRRYDTRYPEGYFAAIRDFAKGR
jgi:dienelactone hydrolase